MDTGSKVQETACESATIGDSAQCADGRMLKKWAAAAVAKLRPASGGASWPFTAELFDEMVSAGGLQGEAGEASLMKALDVLFSRLETFRVVLGDGLELDIMTLAREDERYPGDITIDWRERAPRPDEIARAVTRYQQQLGGAL